MQGLPAVVTLCARAEDITEDDVSLVEACQRLEKAGAAVVGLNCGRGPLTMLPTLKKIRQACKGPLAALPVVYRTRSSNPTMQSLVDPDTGSKVFPIDLPALACSRREVAEFARAAKDIGIQYVGLCCGNASHYTRVVAEVFGKSPPASQYSPDISQHFIFGSDPRFLRETISEKSKKRMEKET